MRNLASTVLMLAVLLLAASLRGWPGARPLHTVHLMTVGTKTEAAGAAACNGGTADHSEQA
jgi:hypothetical protein